ncbi:Uncharacterized protein ChrSV_3352 [Chromobacterium vaccinii]|nr:Uncharacterized protein ChrSW_3352 [Chromobacterium vaccinii]QND90809.1 Uncharacterized protein ChrSV_3352 [Chromobacterium vaccinii]
MNICANAKIAGAKWWWSGHASSQKEENRNSGYLSEQQGSLQKYGRNF